MRKLLIGIIVIGLAVGVIAAQEDAPEVIGAGNVARLGSVGQINFTTDVLNGRFFIDNQALVIAVFDRHNRRLIWDDDGQLIGDELMLQGSNGDAVVLIDADFSFSGESMGMIYTDGEQHYAYKQPTILVEGLSNFPIPSEEMLLEVWVDDAPFDLWAYDGRRILQTLSPTELTPVTTHTPDADPESVIRIGRIEPPLAVTVTEDGRVKRWNMETGEVTAEVQVDIADGLPIYGAVNAGGDEYLVWRDPASTALHVLNFETGEDARIVELGGSYMPFIFLSSAADVIIGVNVDDASVVVAWDVATGTRYDLGEYRECNRPPDMARLSQDGTTLVIGCDTGLDIWRVR